MRNTNAAALTLIALSPGIVYTPMVRGSTDETLSRLRAWGDHLPLRLLTAPGASISAGQGSGPEGSTGWRPDARRRAS